MSIKGYLQKRFIGWLIKDLYNTIDSSDLLKRRKADGVILYRGTPLDISTVNEIKHQANTLKGWLLWEILSNEAKYVSNQRMFDKLIVPEDSIFGKALLYLLVEVIEKKIDEISRF